MNEDTSQTATPCVDPNDWLTDYATDPWYLKHCITTDAEIYSQRIWIGDRTLVPQSRVTEIIDSYHNGVLQGHWGIAKTIAIIKRNYFIIPRTRHTLSTMPDNQNPQTKTKRPTRPTIPTNTKKWQSFHVDWINFPRYPRFIDLTSYGTVLIFTHRATKMVHLVPTTMHTTADETTKFFIKHVVKYHGIPRSIHSDRDPDYPQHYGLNYVKNSTSNIK